MLSLATTKSEIYCVRSGYAMRYLLCVNMICCGALWLEQWGAVPWAVLLGLNVVMGYRIWHYEPRLLLSGEQITYRTKAWLVSRYSRIGVGFCFLVLRRAGRYRLLLIFADSLAPVLYRRLCLVIRTKN